MEFNISKGILRFLMQKFEKLNFFLVSRRSVRLPSDMPSCHFKHLGERNRRENRPGGSERISSTR